MRRVSQRQQIYPRFPNAVFRCLKRRCEPRAKSDGARRREGDAWGRRLVVRDGETDEAQGRRDSEVAGPLIGKTVPVEELGQRSDAVDDAHPVIPNRPGGLATWLGARRADRRGSFRCRTSRVQSLHHGCRDGVDGKAGLEADEWRAGTRERVAVERERCSISGPENARLGAEHRIDQHVAAALRQSMVDQVLAAKS